MVAISFCVFYNYLQTALVSSSSNISSLSVLLKQVPHKFLSFQTSATNDNNNNLSSTKNNKNNNGQVLYPRRLKQQEPNKGTFIFDTITASDFFSQSILTNTTITKDTNNNKNDDSILTTTIKPNDNINLVTGLDMPVTPHYVAPRAPIVLCHGLYGFDLWGPDAFPALQFHYWQGIEDALAKLGAKVIVTGVPKTGSIRERAQELHAVLKAIMKDKDVNFVAHSMGGLDCRYLLSHIKDRPYRPRSLTTICTPHQGSPVMDWFRDHVGVGEQKPGNPCNQRSLSAMTVSMKNSVTRTEEFATASMMAYYNHHHNNNDDDDDLHVPLSDRQNKTQSQTQTQTQNQKLLNLKLKLGLLPKAMIDYFDEPAYGNLTTDYCQEFFNPNTPDDLGVQYYSYGAAAKIPAWSSLLSTPWQIVKDKEGDNDGIVSIKSAKWGKYIKTVEADHWDLSGKSCIPYRWQSDSSSTFDREAFYLEMATRLYHQGH